MGPGRGGRDTTTDPGHASGPVRLEGEIALVTGASSGLGERFAQVLLGAGAHVVVTARRAERLDELARRCGPGIEPIAGDIADASFRQSLIDRVAAAHGRLDLLVNNAGTADDGPIREQSLAELQRVVDVNLVSVLDLCRLAAPLLLAAPAGRVVNVASMFGVVASPGPMAGYNATKGAVVHLTRHLAAQWGAQGVRVNALAPGYFPTEMTGHFEDLHLRRAIERRTLLGRAARLEEIDGPLLFLASPASSYVTGQVLLVDGGWTAV
jgi:NAD(P)-dependent dehydrogenase (short-subunit alcohol dehydrogenase family)